MDNKDLEKLTEHFFEKCPTEARNFFHQIFFRNFIRDSFQPGIFKLNADIIFVLLVIANLGLLDN